MSVIKSESFEYVGLFVSPTRVTVTCINLRIVMRRNSVTPTFSHCELQLYGLAIIRLVTYEAWKLHVISGLDTLSYV